LLTDLAESSINIDAESGDDEETAMSASRGNGRKKATRKTGSKSVAASNVEDDSMEADSDDEMVGAGSNRDGSM
jgi:hypothetical protein